MHSFRVVFIVLLAGLGLSLLVWGIGPHLLHLRI